MKTDLPEPFVDDRGTIQDLFGHTDAVTLIRSVKGAVRGNHFHKHTTQWTYVLSGRLQVKSGNTDLVVEPGEMVVDTPGVPHAWRALEDTDCLVFTKGPRSGAEYESDTFRLHRPLLV